MGGCPGIGVPAEISGDEEQREGATGLRHDHNHHDHLDVDLDVFFYHNGINNNYDL